MIKVDGKVLAGKIIAELKSRPTPSNELAAVLVGENAASASFLKQKGKIADELGIRFVVHNLSAGLSERELIAELIKIISSANVGGFILQLPLPEKYDRAVILSVLPAEKDVDALTGKGTAVPPAVLAVQDILKEVNFPITDKVVGVVGRGLLVGRPIAEWFSGKCREVVVFHTGTDLARIKDCDLVICGTGKSGLIRQEMLKAGAGVIDFGFGMVDGKIRGDFDPPSLVISHSLLSFYTPTPGGTGPVLVAELFRNFYKLSK